MFFKVLFELQKVIYKPLVSNIYSHLSWIVVKNSFEPFIIWSVNYEPEGLRALTMLIKMSQKLYKQSTHILIFSRSDFFCKISGRDKTSGSIIVFTFANIDISGIGQAKVWPPNVHITRSTRNLQIGDCSFTKVIV